MLCVPSTVLAQGVTTEDDTQVTQKDVGVIFRPDVKPEDYKNGATIQGLNKITARNQILEVQKESPIIFGNLEITLHECWQAPPEEQPENAAFLSVHEQIPGEKKQKIFHGWMFASSPALSALEHPIYDIILISCDNFDYQDVEKDL